MSAPFSSHLEFPLSVVQEGLGKRVFHYSIPSPCCGRGLG